MRRRIKDDVSKLTSLGSQKTVYPNHSGADPRLLEAFPNKFKGHYHVELKTTEFTSLCPKTAQPDFAKITVRYVPDKLCIESKGFKLYMFSYRTERSFMETITNNILRDLVNLVKPKMMTVVGEFAARGGVELNVVATYMGENVKSTNSTALEKAVV